MIDRHLQAIIMRQRGQNGELAREIFEHISEKGKERLFRILRDMEDDKADLQRKVRQPWMMR
jgi:uncharacterized protein YrzB (UPF0473 family)